MTTNEAIDYLWQIIDDIDTASDICKGNMKCYENIVQKLQAKRWNTPITTDGYELDLSGLDDTVFIGTIEEKIENDSPIAFNSRPTESGKGEL